MNEKELLLEGTSAVKLATMTVAPKEGHWDLLSAHLMVHKKVDKWEMYWAR